MADKQVLMYKGHPLMRKDNLVYYGSMADKYIVMLQILETKKVQDVDVATRVSVQLQLTDPAIKSRDRVVKKVKKMDSTQRWMSAVSGLSARFHQNNTTQLQEALLCKRQSVS